MTERSKPILCVDFDGVIHSYTSGWKGETVIPDPPVAGSLQWLWKATEWFDVQVYSSRSKHPPAVVAMKQWMIAHAGLIFDEDHPMRSLNGEYPIGFASEKPAAFLTIDDRAICFEGDWSEIDPTDLLNFKPWNKRPLGATGKFPDGQLGHDDQGELQMGVAWDEKAKLVQLAFGKPVAWLAFPPEQAVEMAKLLLRHSGAKSVDVQF
jgi:hypothetical protein